MMRIVAVRVLQEKVSESASVLAAARVRVVDASIDRAENLRRTAIEDGARAMAGGDRGEWMLAESVRELAGWQQVRLEGVRVERVREAAEKLGQSRRDQMRREQVEKMQRAAREAMVRVAERDAQAQSDDRFLARQHWNAEQTSMKLS